MAATINKQVNPSTNSSRFVVGDRRAVSGTLEQPEAKYVTGGFTVTAAELGFDKYITQLMVGLGKDGKALVSAEKISDSEYKIKFFSAIGTELASESETMKAKAIPFLAVGE